jgi:uncharacterized protein (TIGR02145 family)
MKKIRRTWFVRIIIPGLLLVQVNSCKKEDTKTVTDVEGNIYSTVAIGTQVWMAENLKTTKFNNNSKISLVTSNSVWTNTTNPAYCWYDNDTANKPLYGAIYNWFAVGTGKLCPSGWHVPTHEEFKTLELHLGMTQAEADAMDWRGTNQGTQLKSTAGWDNGGNGTNSSRFSALPGGYRWGTSGDFFNLGALSYWWTSTENGTNQVLYRRLDFDQNGVFAQAVRKQAGKYVRCIKD